MVIEQKELIELLELAWCKGYARGVIKQHEAMDRDILDVLTELGLRVRAKRDNAA